MTRVMPQAVRRHRGFPYQRTASEDDGARRPRAVVRWSRSTAQAARCSAVASDARAAASLGLWRHR